MLHQSSPLHRVQGSVHGRTVAGGGTHRLGPLPQERHPTLCETCAQEYDDSIKNDWSDSRTCEFPEERPEPRPVPKPKSGGWFSRLRS